MARACYEQFALSRICAATRRAIDRSIARNKYRSTHCCGRSRNTPPRKCATTQTVRDTRALQKWRARAADNLRCHAFAWRCAA
eukprot:9628594-Lingulodinium_polyedra.AAC.1